MTCEVEKGRGGERGGAMRVWVSVRAEALWRQMGPQCCIRAASVLYRNSARALHLRDHQQPRDEQSEREWGRESDGPEMGCGVVARRDLVQADAARKPRLFLDQGRAPRLNF